MINLPSTRTVTPADVTLPLTVLIDITWAISEVGAFNTARPGNSEETGNAVSQQKLRYSFAKSAIGLPRTTDGHDRAYRRVLIGRSVGVMTARSQIR